MGTALQPAVGLLERALDYTRLSLSHVTPAALDNPTPCRAWDLSQLLAHMDDALDAFTQASAGTVDLAGTQVKGDVLQRLQAKACGLLGAWTAAEAEAWSSPDPTHVLIGDQRLAPDVLVRAGALEITVHGWDVGQATGRPSPIPDDLAHLLLPIAEELVTEDDRPVRFAAIQPQSGVASYDVVLLGFLGRIA
jgi:uncharacterized protein (TIGR03086 family)